MCIWVIQGTADASFSLNVKVRGFRWTSKALISIKKGRTKRTHEDIIVGLVLQTLLIYILQCLIASNPIGSQPIGLFGIGDCVNL